MTPLQHASTAGRIMESLGRLAPSHHEMAIEAAMLAGTHMLNAILHRKRITLDDADVLHAEYMTLALRTRTQLALPGLVEALDEIEQMRPLFVRGNVAGGQAAAHRALELSRSSAAWRSNRCETTVSIPRRLLLPSG